MNNFLNYKKGALTINSYRMVNAVSTDVNDIVRAYEEESEEILTANLEDWIKEELNKINISGLTRNQAEKIIFEENDFLEKVIEDKLGLNLYDYPDLRDLQRDYIEDNI